MKTITKTFLMTLVLTCAILATACPERTSISKIESNPSKYVGKKTVVAGKVTNSFGIALIGGVYKIDDGTGTIWVVTTRSAPAKGALVGVKGEVQDGVNYGGKNYGLGLIEEERKSQ